MSGLVAKKGPGGGYGIGAFGHGLPTSSGGGGCCCGGCPCPHHPTQYALLDAIGGEPNFLGKCRYSGATTSDFNHGRHWRMRVRMEVATELSNTVPVLSQKETHTLEYQVHFFRVSDDQLFAEGRPLSDDGAVQYALSRYFVPDSNLIVEHIDKYLVSVHNYWVVALEAGDVGTFTREVYHPTDPIHEVIPYNTTDLSGIFRQTFGDLLIDYGEGSHSEVFDMRHIVNPLRGECEQPVFNAGRFMRESLLRLINAAIPSIGSLWCLGNEFSQDERDSIYACGGDHLCTLYPEPGSVNDTVVFSSTSVRITTGPLAGAMRVHLWDTNFTTSGNEVYPGVRDATGMIQYAIDLIDPCGREPVDTDFIEPPEDRDPECLCVDPTSGPTILTAIPCDQTREPIGYDVLLWQDRPSLAQLLYLEEPNPDGGDPLTFCYTPTFVPFDGVPVDGLRWTPASCNEAPCAPPPGFRIARRCSNPNETVVVDTRNASSGPGIVMAVTSISEGQHCYYVTDEPTEGPQTPGLTVFRSLRGCASSRCNPEDPQPPLPGDRPGDIPNEASAPIPGIPEHMIQGAVFRKCQSCGG